MQKITFLAYIFDAPGHPHCSFLKNRSHNHIQLVPEYPSDRGASMHKNHLEFKNLDLNTNP